MSRNAISAKSWTLYFQSFPGEHALDPLEGLKFFFIAAAWLKNFFQDWLPPKQKTLDRTLAAVNT